jgi:hypothetical protein
MSRLGASTANADSHEINDLNKQQHGETMEGRSSTLDRLTRPFDAARLTPASARHGLSGCVFFKHQLHENQIKPSVEFAADRAKLARARETEPRVQPQRRLVRCFDPSHHHVLPHGAGARNQFIHQAMTDASSSCGRVDIDGMLDRVAIAVPWPEGAERRISQNIRAFGGDQDRKAGLPVFGEPGDPLLQTGSCSFQIAVVFATASL